MNIKLSVLVNKNLRAFRNDRLFGLMVLKPLIFSKSREIVRDLHPLVVAAVRHWSKKIFISPGLQTAGSLGAHPKG